MKSGLWQIKNARRKETARYVSISVSANLIVATLVRFVKNNDKTHNARFRLLKNLKVKVKCAGDKIEKNDMGWACGAYG